MRRLYVLFLIVLCLPFCASAQNSKKVKALQRQKAELQKTLNKSQSDLTKTKKQVQTGQRDLHLIGQQLESRLDYIKRMEDEMDQLDVQMDSLQSKIADITAQLNEKKAKLKNAFRYARSTNQKTSSLLFVLSANTFTQMFRRARYAREYVLYEQDLAEQVMNKQNELLEAQNKLLSSKSHMNDLLREVMTQRKALNIQQVSTQKKVKGLKEKESGLANQIQKQQQQLKALDKKIDDLIAYEIEQARKKAEEAARRKAEEEARKQAQTAAKSSKSKSSKSSNKTEKSESTTASSENSSSSTTAKTSTPKGSWLTAQDRQLNGTFEQNKGRLPVPITGQYMLGNRFGLYNVPGLKNVQLDNKGTNYIGKSGARARSIFDGEVTAVFQFAGAKNVLVRHGSYISVYCNLSSVIVSKGQKVHTGDILGTVMDDGSGNCVLHFQLRKETAKLNPEAWISR